MAKYIGLLSSDARGKLGGLVLSRSRSGTTLKAKTIPKAPTSVGQRAAQATIASAIGSWRALTVGNRTTWSVYADTILWSNSLGGTYTPTGQQLYTQAYINASRMASAPPANFPNGYTPPPPVVSSDISLGGGILNVSVGAASGTWDNPFLCFAARAVGPSVLYTSHLARRFMGSSTGANNVDIQTRYVAAYGALPALSSYLAVKIVPMVTAVWISGTLFAAAVEVNE